MHFVKKILIILSLFIIFTVDILAQQYKTEVILIGTMHQLHKNSGFYDFNDIKIILNKVHPAIICVELSPEHLASLQKQKNKIEYEYAIFPYANSNNCILIPMEPEEPRRTKLINEYISLNQEIENTIPNQVTALEKFNQIIYDSLLSNSNSPLDINSGKTLLLTGIKHEFQNKIYGEGPLWDKWNNNFLEVILRTVSENPGKRIAVTVGFEHLYWLKAKLEKRNYINLFSVKDYVTEKDFE